jgi:hypothetical protein
VIYESVRAAALALKVSPAAIRAARRMKRLDQIGRGRTWRKKHE